MYGIEAMKTTPAYKKVLLAISRLDHESAAKYNMRINHTYHPNRCVRQGCTETCAQTFEYYLGVIAENVKGGLWD
jgi:hypothetical protein